MSIISLHAVTRRFGRTLALDRVDLTVDRPQVIGLVGRNGAGKSTLLRLLPPLIHPHAGEVRVFDLDPWVHQEAVKHRLGYVSDRDSIPYGVRTRDLFALCATTQPRWDAALVGRFCARLGLDAGASFNGLSQGQQRQVSLLCAIGHRPELLLLDEPAANFDVAVRREFLAVVIDLLAETGSTVMMATHLLADLERLAERLVVIHAGAVRYDGGLDAMKQGLCRIELARELVPAAALAAWPLCLHVHTGSEGVEAVLDCAVDEAPARLRQAFGDLARPSAVQGLGLEDAFIHRTQDARPGQLQAVRP